VLQITLSDNLEAVLAVSAVGGTSARGVLNPHEVTSSQRDLGSCHLAEQVLPLIQKVLIHGFGFLHEVIFLRISIAVPDGGQEALTFSEITSLCWNIVMPLMEVG
jgi:hypothetical protein